MISVSSREENYQCALAQAQGDDVIIDVPSERGGTGVGLIPYQLLEAALASCMNISLRKNAEKMGIELQNVETFVHLNRETEGKTVFEYGYTISDGLDAVLQAELAEVLNICAVRKMLSGEIEIKEVQRK